MNKGNLAATAGSSTISNSNNNNQLQYTGDVANSLAGSGEFFGKPR